MIRENKKRCTHFNFVCSVMSFVVEISYLDASQTLMIYN